MKLKYKRMGDSFGALEKKKSKRNSLALSLQTHWITEKVVGTYHLQTHVGYRLRNSRQTFLVCHVITRTIGIPVYIEISLSKNTDLYIHVY